MVIKHKGNQEYEGLAADTKPLAADTALNATFAETDTGFQYRNNGTSWLPYGSAAANASGYKYFIYLDTVDNKFKARNGKTGAIDYTSNDAADAQPVIHNAIIADSNAPGKILLAGNTTFPLVSMISTVRQIQLYSGQWLQGCGWSTKIQGRPALGPNNASGIVSPRDGTDCIVSDLCIDGQNIDGVNNTSAAAGNLHCVNLERLWVYNVKSINSPQRGMLAYNCKYVNFSNNYVEVSALEDSAGGYAGHAGIHCAVASEECIVANNIIKNPGGEAIGTHTSNKNVSITGNVIIVTTDSPLTTEIGRGHILIETNPPDPADQHIIIANNNITNNYYGIVAMGGSSHISIYGNTINSLTSPNSIAQDYSGIKITNNAFNIKIHNNDLYNIKGHGILVTAPIAMVDISNNTIRNIGSQAVNTYDGINANFTGDCSIARIQNNNIYDDRGGSSRTRDGVRVSVSAGKTLTGLVIGGNQVIGQTGLRTNILNSGTLTYDSLVNPYIIDSTWHNVSSTDKGVRYISVTSTLVTPTEANVQATIPYNFRITRVIAKMSSNSVNGNTIICLRDDGADAAGTSFTFAAGSTAEQDSGTLSTLVAAGSKINIKVDTTASATGNWLFSHYTVYGYWE